MKQRLTVVLFLITINGFMQHLASAQTLGQTAKIYRGVYVVKNLPDSWKLFKRGSLEQNDGSPLEFRPGEQFNDDWSENIIVRTFNDKRSVSQDFLAKLLFPAECEKANQLPSETGSRIGYSMVTVLQQCSFNQQIGKKTVSITKLVENAKSIVIGQRTIRLSSLGTELSDRQSQSVEVLRSWALGFYLCNSYELGSCPAGRESEWQK